MPITSQPLATATHGSSLADVLERVLDKGIVIAGDITVSVGNVELLTVRIRLLISSVDKAKEIGINWWEADPYLHSQARELLETNRQLLQRVSELEKQLAQGGKETE
ncbi:gas vesicle protein [Synechococcus sp. H65.1]|uniref:gas vesicle protein n=1 Tax=unclassified Synechococcus TaxID=2626047 RepID=UPI0039C1A8C9